MCENTYFEPLTMFLQPTVRPVEVSKNTKIQIEGKIDRKKKDTGGVYFTTMGARSHLSPEILSLHCGRVHDEITGNKFHQNRLRGFRATGVRKTGTPIDLACRPYNSPALPC